MKGAGTLRAQKQLAVPSYGAMALKPQQHFPQLGPSTSLAVPSYGAMALKLSLQVNNEFAFASCSPLLRGDGPETR